MIKYLVSTPITQDRFPILYDDDVPLEVRIELFEYIEENQFLKPTQQGFINYIEYQLNDKPNIKKTQRIKKALNDKGYRPGVTPVQRVYSA